ncbi:MAG TPA: PDZ domain-containing protein, partial [Gemmatimonadota bacterium]|nr:PDZ domain-containing protein [Gemmatimonadota bacterium]
MANVDRAGMLALAAAAALIVWGIVGFFDRMGQGWGGYTYSPDYVVNYVQPDGPGEEAGMEMGDRVISVEGMPVEELPLYSRWPRSLAPKVGESRRLTVERDGEMLALDVVYGDNASRTMSLRLGAALVGLCFMAFGLWAFLTVSTPPARILGA